MSSLKFPLLVLWFEQANAHLTLKTRFGCLRTPFRSALFRNGAFHSTQNYLNNSYLFLQEIEVLVCNILTGVFRFEAAFALVGLFLNYLAPLSLSCHPKYQVLLILKVYHWTESKSSPLNDIVTAGCFSCWFWINISRWYFVEFSSVGWGLPEIGSRHLFEGRVRSSLN